MAVINRINFGFNCLFFFTIFFFTGAFITAFADISNSQDKKPKPNEHGKGPLGLANTFDHKGDFSVITIGTGSPAYNPIRSGPSALVHSNGRYFLVDMGNGTQARLIQAGIPFKDINIVMFTHLHLDHSEEFIPILINSWLQGQDNLKIIGPRRTKQYYDFLMTFYKEDIEYRAWRTGRPMDKIKDIEIKELKGDVRLELYDIIISTSEVVHTIYTLAMRFDKKDMSIVISGDLSYSGSLAKLAKDADILVIDCGHFIRKKEKVVGPRSGDREHGQTGDKDRPPTHGSLNDVARMAVESNAKKLVLTHFGPGEVDESATLNVLRKQYRGEILFGEDLLEIVP